MSSRRTCRFPCLIFISVLVSPLLYSCGTAYVAPSVTPELVKASPSPKSKVERGYVIHQVKCAKCHLFEDPADYELNELKYEIMPVMARKAKLSDTDADAVLAYLIAARGSSPKVAGAN